MIPIALMQMSETTMRNKYYLQNNQVIDYLSNVASDSHIIGYEYSTHRKNLQKLCRDNANCREFCNAMACLKVIVGT